MSKFQEVDTSKMSKDELIALALELNVELNGEESMQTLKAKIRRQRGINEPEYSAKPLSGQTRTINISRTERSGPAVFVGHNGRHYRIQTGVDVPVPAELVGVLRDAKTTEYPEDPVTKQRIPVDVPTYPFSVVS